MINRGNQGSAVSPLLWAFALAAILIAVSLSATRASSAGAQVQDGGIIIFDECAVVSVEVLASDALFTSVFWRFSPDGSLGITNKQVGETAVIGEVPANTELILGIHVNFTDRTFMTGPADRNPDNMVHAVVSGDTVGFEDKALGEPNADWDYDDAVLRITTEPCSFNLIVQVDPASTGTGSTEGSGTYPAGSDALAKAIVGPASTFVAWSGDCAGGSPADHVLMDADKVCNALFAAVEPPVEPTPQPTPEPTPAPEVEAAAIGIDNTLASANPAHVGEEVTFRVDVGLTDVPAENTAVVWYSFDDSELAYVAASYNGTDLSQCALMSAGVIHCDFGTVSSGFSYNLLFEALQVAEASTTEAALDADFDGGGPLDPAMAGPALADVDIIDVEGISLPPLGDGSVTAAGTGPSFQLVALLGAVVLATTGLAVRLRTGARS
jgi:hypothetical protein